MTAAGRSARLGFPRQMGAGVSVIEQAPAFDEQG
jgi:hypothetical protein